MLNLFYFYFTIFFWGGGLYLNDMFVDFFVEVEKYRLLLTSTVPTSESFINAIVASVSNFTNNRKVLKPCCIACRISICIV